MNEDLKIIKKKYGEKMMRLCRDMFPSLLEEKGLLSGLLLSHFEPSHDLYNDLERYRFSLFDGFERYINSLVATNKRELVTTSLTPKELLDQAGYTLYECKTEEDIQKFKKYYAEGEELCTFRGNRLKHCYVFFAVKKDVDSIKREDYKEPFREDRYGTSVISIQFTRSNSYLSIKNRYNHTVPNPDATFNNNLDNIIPGLSYAFQKQYGLSYCNIDDSFYIPSYVQAKDGKYYKYNYEINNIYYCPNNIIIDNFKVNRYSDEYQRYLVIDYFVIDRENKTIDLYDEEINNSTAINNTDSEGELYAYDEIYGDSFIEYFKENEIENIKIVTNIDGTKSIVVSVVGKEDAIIIIDKDNHIIGYKNNNITSLGDNFLMYNETLTKIDIRNVRYIGNNFLSENCMLKLFASPELLEVGDRFLFRNNCLNELLLPRLEVAGNEFLTFAVSLIDLYLPKVKKVGNNFLTYGEIFKNIYLPLLEVVGDYFIAFVARIENIDIGSLREHGIYFLDSYRGSINIRKSR